MMEKPLSYFLSQMAQAYKCCAIPCRSDRKTISMTHAQLVERAVRWLRSYRCGVVLSEQACVSGEMPDAMGWKQACHSVLVECKVTRADFLADRAKPFRLKPEKGVGSERFYLTPAGLLKRENCRRVGDCWNSAAAGSRCCKRRRRICAPRRDFATR